MARSAPKTPFLELPLRLVGLEGLRQSVKSAFEKIDTWAAGVAGGTVVDAADVAYNSGNPGDSNSSDTTVQGALDTLFAEVNRLNSRTDSNSQG